MDRRGFRISSIDIFYRVKVCITDMHVTHEEEMHATLILYCQTNSLHVHFDAHDFYQGLVRFEDQGFPSVRELLDYHVKNQVPVTKKSQAIVVTPVKKEKDKWEMCRADLVLQEKKLGQGHFGDVMKGVLRPSNVPVAVKSCKESVSQVVKKKFLAEAEILKQYDHPNIVRLIGVCAEKEPVFIGNC